MSVLKISGNIFSENLTLGNWERWEDIIEVVFNKYDLEI